MFVIISDTDDSLNFLVSIMYTQLFNLLCTIADDEYHGKLPVHVRCILDEFANIGQIPKFDKLIVTIRSRGTSQSYGLNYQKLGRELMSQDRLALMDGGKCILQVRGVRPFFSDKVDITANEMYKELSDFDKKNQFDIEKYVSEYGKPKFAKII